jgi:hypothetical protein
MSPPADRLTILRTKGLPATKTLGLGPHGEPVVAAAYGQAKRFSIRQESVDGIHALAAVLDSVRWDEFVLLGEPLPGTDRTATVRRLHADPVTGERPTFREQARRYVLLDFDHLPGPYRFDPLDGELAAEHARATLPAACRRATCWWQLTSSAGVKPGVRLRLAFWLDRALGKAELERLFAGVPVDPSTFRPLQPIYVAPPILRGVADPVRRRSGVLVDRDDAVPVPALPELVVAPRASAAAPVAPTHSPAGKRYISGDTPEVARERLAALCGAVERASAGGRHRCLLWAAARAVELDDALSRAEIAAALAAAARGAGIEDRDEELRRHVLNGFKLGIFGAKPCIAVEAINGARVGGTSGEAA